MRSAALSIKGLAQRRPLKGHSRSTQPSLHVFPHASLVTLLLRLLLPSPSAPVGSVCLVFCLLLPLFGNSCASLGDAAGDGSGTVRCVGVVEPV